MWRFPKAALAEGFLPLFSMAEGFLPLFLQSRHTNAFGGRLSAADLLTKPEKAGVLHSEIISSP